MNASFARHAQSTVSDSRRPRLLPLLIVIAAVLIVSVLPAMAGADNSETRPTIVLVHGAWASAPGWDMVVAGLHKDGYPTPTPTLGLFSIPGDLPVVPPVPASLPGPQT